MREANDLKISAAIRRELSSRRVDLTKLKFPIKAGEVALQGELEFVGVEKSSDEIAVELKFIETSIKAIEGVSKLTFELTNWKQNESGIWESAHGHGNSSFKALTGEGLVCPECDFVIRFCPCCGKPLVPGAKPGMHKTVPGRATRKTLPPIKPIARKPRPTLVPSIGSATSPISKPTNSVKPENTQATPAPTANKPAESAITETKKPAEVIVKGNNNTATKPLKPLKPSGDSKPFVAEKPATVPKAEAPAINNVSTPVAEVPTAPEMVAPVIASSETNADVPMPDFLKSPAATQNVQPTAPEMNFGGEFGLGMPQQPGLDSNPGMGFDMNIGEAPAPAVQPPMADLGMGFDMNIGQAPAPAAQSPMPDLGIGFDMNIGEAAPQQAPTPEPPAQKHSIGGYVDEDTPLPPMKPATPATPATKKPAKKQKDIFASLFNDNVDDGSGNNLDLNLDVLEIFPNGDQSNNTTAAPASGKAAKQPAKAAEDSNPFNLDNVLDLDSMMNTAPAPGEKDSTGTFNLDDFDINQFKF